MSIELKWVAHCLWVNQPHDLYVGRNIPLTPSMRRTCVGQYAKTKKGTYWEIHFYMGNIRTAVPTEQEARDLLMLLARSHYGN
jgi:hypothetical protein